MGGWVEGSQWKRPRSSTGENIPTFEDRVYLPDADASEESSIAQILYECYECEREESRMNEAEDEGKEEEMEPSNEGKPRKVRRWSAERFICYDQRSEGNDDQHTLSTLDLLSNPIILDRRPPKIHLPSKTSCQRRGATMVPPIAAGSQDQEHQAC